MSPIYTYRCDTCGYQFDDLAPMDSVPERPCGKRYPTRDDLSGDICTGIARRVPSIPAPAQFRCSMPTAPTKHHKGGNK